MRGVVFKVLVHSGERIIQEGFLNSSLSELIVTDTETSVNLVVIVSIMVPVKTA